MKVNNLCQSFIIICSQVYNQPEWYTDLLDYINLFFTFFFVGEFMLKFGAYRFKNYFSDPWNGFDFFIVVGSLIDLGFAQLAPDSEVNQNSWNHLLQSQSTSQILVSR